jgi:hypothetical protein
MFFCDAHFGDMLKAVSKTSWAPVAFFAATPSYQPSTTSKGEAPREVF